MRIVGGRFRGKKLAAPIHQGTRPTSDRARETLFNILLHNPHLGPQVFLGKRVLDVFAGTGALGLEALSRGAETVSFIEKDPAALKILRENLKAFDLPALQIFEEDATHLSRSFMVPFDLIFFDPPYHQNLLLPSLENLYHKGWLGEGAIVVMEVAKDENIIIPSFLTLVLERTSGAAKLLFFRYGK
ncbi:MAG: 16S rRNA (guanine(966)-N(2))-methyltransferase RsmD [Alphaproteobacteria bacterium]|nr:16S rRNA (guanine(966)-N(2))-methyltransferase RsmD [Alphaproteobacteria bacterium]